MRVQGITKIFENKNSFTIPPFLLIKQEGKEYLTTFDLERQTLKTFDMSFLDDLEYEEDKPEEQKYSFLFLQSPNPKEQEVFVIITQKDEY